MKKEEIHVDDIHRILFGQAPPMFLVEVLIRTLIIYLCLLLVVRWLGKRMSGQLTIMEMAVMLTLGAIVSVAMQIPDRGVILSIALLVCTLTFHRGLSRWGVNNISIEELTQGKLSVLVKDGILQLDEMERCRISRQQLFAELRSSKIYNLGKVKRVYLEACGLFSVFTTNDSKPGLPVLPPDDKQVLEIQEPIIEMIACVSCGTVTKKKEDLDTCTDCGHDKFVQAVI